MSRRLPKRRAEDQSSILSFRRLFTGNRTESGECESRDDVAAEHPGPVVEETTASCGTAVGNVTGDSETSVSTTTSDVAACEEDQISGTEVRPLAAATSLSSSGGTPVTDDGGGQSDFADIGLLVQNGKFKSLSDSEKLRVIQDHFVPEKNFDFPKVYMNGCNRSFSAGWLTTYPWLVYSKSLDGGFCLPCVLFATGSRVQPEATLLHKPFRRWVKVSDVLK